MRISDWSSDVCSSDLRWQTPRVQEGGDCGRHRQLHHFRRLETDDAEIEPAGGALGSVAQQQGRDQQQQREAIKPRCRSEEHTSELQSLMRISYAVFCLKKTKNIKRKPKETSKYKY